MSTFSFFNLKKQILLKIMEEEGLTGASPQGVIEMFCLHFWEALMLSIHSVWKNSNV